MQNLVELAIKNINKKSKDSDIKWKLIPSNNTVNILIA